MAAGVPKLMGTAEVAEALNTSISNLVRHPQLPKPVQELKCGRIWLQRDITAYQRSRKGKGR